MSLHESLPSKWLAPNRLHPPIFFFLFPLSLSLLAFVFPSPPPYFFHFCSYFCFQLLPAPRRASRFRSGSAALIAALSRPVVVRAPPHHLACIIPDLPGNRKIRICWVRCLLGTPREITFENVSNGTMRIPILQQREFLKIKFPW